jgi:hypothetical protein
MKLLLCYFAATLAMRRSWAISKQTSTLAQLRRIPDDIAFL